jgi:hypothetical protein
LLRLAAPLVTICLLGAIGFDSADRSYAPEGAEAYHRKVAESINLIPYSVDEWVGVDQSISQEALRILDANVSLNRTYNDVETGTSAILLLVHCADARSLLGHYPPVCYPSQGWTQVSASPQVIRAGDLTVSATRYEFAHETLGQSGHIEVLHFTVLPDGRTAPDMDALDRLARDKRSKFYGGASIQFILDARLPESRRQGTYEVLLRAVTEWIETVEAGMSS